MTVITSTTWKSGNKYPHLGRVPKVVIVIILFYLITITDSQQLHYDPVDNITIDCGSSGNLTTQEPRNWNGDIGSKYFPSGGQNKASVTLEAVQRPMVNDHVPYETARLSRSEFTYTIPVTPGPKFVRLYFFSATYENFDPLKAFFDVKVGQYTLLSNFSVSLTADALDLEGIEKEYIVPVEGSFMNITFIPSSSISGAFAFINGIEVVSMPPNLYYSEDAGRELKLVDQDGRSYTIPNYTALEKMYRINIGGKALPPAEDNGMFREWEQESEYLTELGFSVLPFNTTAKLNYKDNISSYAAPDNVYNTGRSTGNGNKSEVRSYNLTWQFPVDSGFSYMLRLHFCEIIQEFTKTGDRVFLIYIANYQAESTFDIIGLSGGQYTPYFQDYMVLMFGSRADQKKVNLSVALQANPSNDLSHYIDAILNGLEIFKLNETNGNLAGPNPGPTTPRSRNVPPPTQPGKNNRTAIVGIVSGVVAGIVILSVLGFFVLRRGRRVKESTPMEGTISFTTTKSSKTRGSSSLPSDLCRYFSLAEIRAATKNFEDIFIIGVGGFGNVYKGYIDNGTTPVAIKRLKAESSQGIHEFKTEIEMLSHLRHRHLVSLIGYCNDDREMILVYDYMARGTLRSHLYNSENPPLAWKQRLEICLGAARGLQYLHTGAKHTIIHRDVKTTNILLDEKWVAKVSDFGLSKTGPTGISKAHVTTVVKGSVGYLDPEYYKRQQLTEKSDVYSFGVVLCEVLCARPPILRTAGKGKVSLAEWAPGCYRDGTLDQIIDPHLTGKIAPECLKKYGEIFVSCMLDNGTERPSMNDIVWGLEFAMQLQQSAEDNDRAGGATITPKDEDAIPFMNDNSDGTFTSSWEDTSESKSSGVTKFSSSDKGSTTNESIKGMSGAVFSEINNNAKGR
ncbi:Mitogen-activated protein kinase kinase kinase [Trema orientale]|uniref:Mitogen-activated protein kinase kinase kinase n=1 Tax=Trema orientale TaxID=63057 RepID=A0A2P5ASF8_TREOI|nr:Mitogen-activated protein kinase kinase kinase [Trema orientale]